MNWSVLHQKLIATARAHRPSDHVPFAFEKRVMARLAAGPVADVLTFWSRGLWRAVAPCLAVMLLLGVWNYLAPSDSVAGTRMTKDLSQDFENTVIAAVSQDNGNFPW